MNIKDLREQYGMKRPEFAEYFGIPYRTLQDWELGTANCPAYLFDLMQYKLAAEAEKGESQEERIYLIFRDSMDDCCYIEGYIKAPDREEADKYCDSYNADKRYEWECLEWIVIENLRK